MSGLNKSDELSSRRFTALRINLQGDDEDGTPYISQTWLNPKLDGGDPWKKTNMSIDGDLFRTSTPEEEQDDDDSSSDSSYRIKSPPVLSGYPKKPRSKSMSGLTNVLKAAKMFKKGIHGRPSSLPLSAREDRLVFPGEPRSKKSREAILAELRVPPRRSKTKVTFEEPDNESLHEAKRPTRKVSHDELDTIVSRLVRPTNSSRARTAAVRPRFFYEDRKRPERKRVNYLMFAPTRFRGLRKVSSEEIEEITQRLHSFDIERWPPNSARGLRGKSKLPSELGVLNSYRWKGVKNC